MYSIFSNAEQVLIWLCGDDKLISEAFRQIPSTLESLREINSKKKQTYLEKNRELQACLDTRVGSARLTRLFEQDWFGRLWVVQEVAAADKVLFVCGSRTMDYKSLDDLAGYVWLYSNLSSSSSANTGWHNFRNICEMRLAKRPELEDGCSLLIKHLHATTLHECFDARDRLFALGGMTAGLNALPYAANYEKDTATVYTDFAIHCAKNLQHTKLLAHSGLSQNRVNDMASWVPDWEGEPDLSLSLVYPELLYFAGGRDNAITQACQLGGTERYPVLMISGAVVDRIEVTWKAPPSPMIDAGDTDLQTGCFLEQCLLYLASYSTHRITWSALWRTLVMDLSLKTGYFSRTMAVDEEIVASAIDWLVEKWQKFRRTHSIVSENDNAEPEYGKPRRDFQSLRRSHSPWDRTVRSLKSVVVNGARSPSRRRFSKRMESLPNNAEIFTRILQRSIRYGYSICVTDSGRLGKCHSLAFPWFWREYTHIKRRGSNTLFFQIHGH